MGYLRLFAHAGADLNGLAACQKEAEALAASGDAASVSVAAIRELLKVHTAYFHTKDMRLGGTPLHWVTEKASMEAFIGMLQLKRD